MNPGCVPQDLAVRPGSAIDRAVPDYPDNIDKEVMVKGI